MKKQIKAIAFALALAISVPSTAMYSPAVSINAATKAPALSYTKATVIIGNTLTLKVNNLEEGTYKKIAWKANRTSIAKVNSKGKITPVKAGTTTVICTITYNDGTTEDLKCTVTVKNRVAATKVKFTNVEKNAAGYMEVPIGTTCQLTTALTPSKSTDRLYWSSNNTKVAKVSSSGVITPVKYGTCTITVRAGLNATTANADDNKIKATLKIKVVPLSANAVEWVNEEFALNPSTTLLTGDTLQLEAKLFPENTTDKIFFLSDNEEIATVSDDGVVTALKAGTCIVYATAGPDKKTANADDNLTYAGLWIKVTENFNAEEVNAELVAIKDAALNATVTFGKYEQDHNDENGPEDFSWYVIGKTDTKALLLSKFVIDAVQYNPGFEQGTTWEDCSLRQWLNDSFYTNSFNAMERDYISNTVTNNDTNPAFNTANPASSIDKVFLLSIEEACKYLGFAPSVNNGVYLTSSYYANGYATKHAKKNGLTNASKIGNATYSWWILRTPGSDMGRVAFVDDIQQIELLGSYTAKADMGLRPAIWVDFSSLTGK